MPVDFAYVSALSIHFGILLKVGFCPSFDCFGVTVAKVRAVFEVLVFSCWASKSLAVSLAVIPTVPRAGVVAVFRLGVLLCESPVHLGYVCHVAISRSPCRRSSSGSAGSGRIRTSRTV